MVYVTGDLHGDFSRFKAPALKQLRRGDTLTVCGDFGFIWEGGKKEQRVLKKLGNLGYTLAFIDGVHENHHLLSEYGEVSWNGGRARHICGDLYYLMRGQVFTIEGKTIFALGGGENPDLDFEISALDDCMPTNADLVEARRNLQRCDYRVDYVVTHDCTGTVKSFLNMDSNSYNHLYAFFNESAKIMTFRRWFFGCQHLDKAIPPKYMGVFREVHRLD